MLKDSPFYAGQWYTKFNKSIIGDHLKSSSANLPAFLVARSVYHQKMLWADCNASCWPPFTWSADDFANTWSHLSFTNMHSCVTLDLENGIIKRLTLMPQQNAKIRISISFHKYNVKPQLKGLKRLVCLSYSDNCPCISMNVFVLFRLLTLQQWNCKKLVTQWFMPLDLPAKKRGQQPENVELTMWWTCGADSIW